MKLLDRSILGFRDDREVTLSVTGRDPPFMMYVFSFERVLAVLLDHHPSGSVSRRSFLLLFGAGLVRPIVVTVYAT